MFSCVFALLRAKFPLCWLVDVFGNGFFKFLTNSASTFGSYDGELVVELLINVAGSGCSFGFHRYAKNLCKYANMSSDNLKKFAASLKKLRDLNRVSQAKLAEAVGVSSGTVAHWERAKNFPTQETVWKLCKYFRISQDELFGGIPELPIPENSEKTIALSPVDQELAKMIAVARSVSVADAVSLAIRELVQKSMKAQALTQRPGLNHNNQQQGQEDENPAQKD